MSEYLFVYCLVAVFMMTTPLTTSHEWNAYLQQKKPWYDAIALTYTLAGYIGGVALLTANLPWLNLIGVLLTTHTLVLSAYYAHEFMHGSIFGSMRTNYAWGSVMQWMHGTAYIDFKEFSQGHIDHHIDGVDYFGFDRIAFINGLPQFAQKLIAALEWAYFPALFLTRQWIGIWLLYQRAESQSERLRVVAVLLIRIALFAALAAYSLKAVLLYFLCYLGMVHIVLLMDCLQHTYEVHLYSEKVSRKGLEYERTHTFSTPLSRRFPWLNWLLLNFSYHNAHHTVMKCPWYNLPALDRDITQVYPTRYVGLGQVFANYHRFRIHRIFSTDEGCTSFDEQGNLKFDQFYGVAGGTSILLA